MPSKKMPAKGKGSTIGKAIRHSKLDRTWPRMARLAEDALAALEENNMREARACLEAIRGISMSAENQ